MNQDLRAFRFLAILGKIVAHLYAQQRVGPAHQVTLTLQLMSARLYSDCTVVVVLVVLVMVVVVVGGGDRSGDNKAQMGEPNFCECTQGTYPEVLVVKHGCGLFNGAQ